MKKGRENRPVVNPREVTARSSHSKGRVLAIRGPGIDPVPNRALSSTGQYRRRSLLPTFKSRGGLRLCSYLNLSE